MRKTSCILGLVGAGLALVIIVLVPVAWRADFAAFVFNPLVGAMIGLGLISVPAMAVAAVVCSGSRSAVSARLYFVAAGVGLVFLSFIGLLLTRVSPWAFAFVLPVFPLTVAGALVRKAGAP